MSATAIEGRITADSVYTLAEIQQRLGLGVHAIRMARRAGLPERYIGRRGFVLGKDLIAYIESSAKSKK
jgi:hypothetical protein